MDPVLLFAAAVGVCDLLGLIVLGLSYSRWRNIIFWLLVILLVPGLGSFVLLLHVYARHRRERKPGRIHLSGVETPDARD